MDLGWGPESFVHSQKLQDAIDIQFENDSEATIELFVHFLAFVTNSINSDPNSSHPQANLLHNAFKHFTESHLASQDMHTFTSAFDLDVRRAIISSYFKAPAMVESSRITDIPCQPPSVLFSAAMDGDAPIYAVFGGQGTNKVYFDELQNLYNLYTPYVAPFVQIITDELFAPLICSSSLAYDHGLDASAWLSGSAPLPPVSYLASITLSFLIIGLTQLIQYLVAFKVADLMSLSRSSSTTFARLFLYFAKSNSSHTLVDLIFLLIISNHMTLILSYPHIFTFILTHSLSFSQMRWLFL